MDRTPYAREITLCSHNGKYANDGNQMTDCGQRTVANLSYLKRVFGLTASADNPSPPSLPASRLAEYDELGVQSPVDGRQTYRRGRYKKHSRMSVDMVTKQAHVADLVDLDFVLGRLELFHVTPGFLALLSQGFNGLLEGVGLGGRHGGGFGGGFGGRDSATSIVFDELGQGCWEEESGSKNLGIRGRDNIFLKAGKHSRTHTQIKCRPTKSEEPHLALKVVMICFGGRLSYPVALTCRSNPSETALLRLGWSYSPL